MIDFYFETSMCLYCWFNNRNRKDVYAPIIPSETDLGMFSEDKKCLLRHFLLDRFFRTFYEYSQTYFSHQKVVIIFVNLIVQLRS